MQAVILAGGRGSRLSEETGIRPKPLVEVGGRPIVWHIMNIYSYYGIDDFVICAGYKGYQFKEYFANLALHNSDVTFDLATGTVEYHDENRAAWRVTVVDTGEETMTAGRVLRAARFLHPDEPFCLTYGDGLADVDISATIAFHRAQGKLATMTAVRPPARFGMLELDGASVHALFEKNPRQVTPINGGFFVVEPTVLDLIDGDGSVWETDVLVPLAAQGQLAAYTHHGFWQPMDTIYEKDQLEDLWRSGEAPWKVW